MDLQGFAVLEALVILCPALRASRDRFILGLLGTECGNHYGLFDISGNGRSVGTGNVSPCLSLFLRHRPADRSSQLSAKTRASPSGTGLN